MTNVADAWTWLAHYEDGSVLPEIDPDGTEHGFAEVDLSRLAAFELRPQRTGLASPVVRINAADGQRPLFFRRRTITMDPSGAESGRQTVTVIGWAKNVRLGKHQVVNIKAITALYEDGSVLISDRDDF